MHADGSQPEEEDWKMWTRFQGDRHVPIAGWCDTSRRAVKRKGKGTGQGGDRSMGNAKGKGKTMEGAGKKGSGKSEGHKGDFQENRKVGDTRDRAGRAVESHSRRQCVDGESLASRRKSPLPKKWRTTCVRGVWRSRRSVDRRACGGRRHRPPGVPIQALGTQRST